MPRKQTNKQQWMTGYVNLEVSITPFRGYSQNAVHWLHLCTCIFFLPHNLLSSLSFEISPYQQKQISLRKQEVCSKLYYYMLLKMHLSWLQTLGDIQESVVLTRKIKALSCYCPILFKEESRVDILLCLWNFDKYGFGALSHLYNNKYLGQIVLVQE